VAATASSAAASTGAQVQIQPQSTNFLSPPYNNVYNGVGGGGGSNINNGNIKNVSFGVVGNNGGMHSSNINSNNNSYISSSTFVPSSSSMDLITRSKMLLEGIHQNEKCE
jgi:hypothetical protein